MLLEQYCMCYLMLLRDLFPDVAIIVFLFLWGVLLKCKYHTIMFFPINRNNHLCFTVLLLVYLNDMSRRVVIKTHHKLIFLCHLQVSISLKQIMKRASCFFFLPFVKAHNASHKENEVFWLLFALFSVSWRNCVLIHQVAFTVPPRGINFKGSFFPKAEN